MKGTFWRILLYIGLFASALLVLEQAVPTVPEAARFWMSLLGPGLLFWMFRADAPVAKEPPPPTLEELERNLAAQTALQWQRRGVPPVRAETATASAYGKRGGTHADAKESGSAPAGPWGGTHKGASPGPSASSAEQEESATGDAARSGGVASRTAGGWVPGDRSATVQNVRIGGLVYVGVAPRGDSGRARGWIDPTLSVRVARRDPEGSKLPYWPSYQDLSPEQRATYLDWLADGRRDSSCDPGYMFLYFYGLERRFLNDETSAAEQHEILAEVARLRDLWSTSGSARRYLGEFLDYAGTLLGDAPEEPPVAERVWELPLRLKVALGARIVRKQALTADWLLVWLKSHPETRLRTAAVRCAPEFDALFGHLFAQRFPHGLIPRTPRKVLSANYRAASGDFEVNFEPRLDGRKLPDVSGLLAPLETARDIAEEATDRLERLSRYLGRKPEGRGTLEAAALLPPEIVQLFPSESLAALADWASSVVAAGGQVPVEDLLARLEGETPRRIGRRQMADAAAALARVGYGLAPDAVSSLRGPRIGEPVVLFEIGLGSDAPPSEAFRRALLQLALGAAVAQADGVVMPVEREALAARIAAAAGLEPGEAARLQANLDWLLAVPPDTVALRARISAASQEEGAGLRAALVAMNAQAGAPIGAAEVAQVERIYRMMGLDPSQVYSDLHAGAIADAPITVRIADRPEAGEKIPDVAPAQPNGMVLDPERIATIRADTEAVAKVLGAIFADAPDAPDRLDEDAETPPSRAPDLPAVFSGLELRQAGFLREVITRPLWSEGEMASLAARHGLMAEGAVETVNEWAFASYDEALLEFYEDYEVSPAIAATLNVALQEDHDVDTQTA